MMDTPAHEQQQTIKLLRFYEAHEPRKSNPGYHLFQQAKTRLKRQGLWKCTIDNQDCFGQIELHHEYIEDAYAPEVDLDKLNELLGLHLTDDTFQEFVQGPGNLEPLCAAHHRYLYGVHRIPAADWTIVRVHKATVIPVQAPTAGHPAKPQPG